MLFLCRPGLEIKVETFSHENQWQIQENTENKNIVQVMNGIIFIVFGLMYGLSKSHLYKCVLKLIIY